MTNLLVATGNEADSAFAGDEAFLSTELSNFRHLSIIRRSASRKQKTKDRVTICMVVRIARSLALVDELQR
jgi:hypothetical protein